MIHYITGRSGSGKTAKLYALVREALEAGFNGNILIIVPEQFTFETERALLSFLPKHGCLHVDVCSFDRLVFRVLAETGGLARTFLSRPGKDMLIRKVMDETETVLSSFGRVSKRAGFAKVLGEWIATFKRCGIEPENLEETAAQIQDEALSDKLSDLARVFAEVERHLGERYLDLEDALRLFLEHASHSSFLRNAKVFVDGFDQLAKQDYDMLEAIMLNAGSLTVTLRLPEATDADAYIFSPEAHVFRTLREIAAKNDIPEEILPASEPIRRMPGLMALERSLFAPRPPVCENDGSVRLYECLSPEAEALACARRIARLVREGARYRDIAVLIPDFTLFSPHIERFFREHDIPYFLDAKRPLTSHSISDCLLGAASAAALGFRQSDMQRVLKSGYAMDDDLAERLSLYMARAGIRDASRPFTRGDESGEMEAARQTLITPLLAFRDAMKANPTAIGCAEALYRYIEAVGLGESLVRTAERLKEEMRYDLARTNAQVYSILMQTLDQIAGIFGDTPLEGTRFLTVLEEGVRTRTIGIIPTTADQILVGDIARTISQCKSFVMALGCNEGLLPRQLSDDDLLSSAERARLVELGLPGWPDGAQKSARERMDIYAAFSRASQRLDLSYSLANNGEKLSPSPIIDSVRRVFPNISPSSDDDALYAPQAAFGPLISALRMLHDGGAAPDAPSTLASTYAWFAKSERWSAELSRIDAALSAQGGMETLPSDISRKLFSRGRGQTSASRIETFARCPFQHFVKYGLSPNIREKYAPHAPDAGSFLHSALDALTKKALAENICWADIDREGALDMLEPLWEPMVAEFENGLLIHNPINKLLARRLKRMIADCFAAIAVHIAAGEFQVAASELIIGDAVPPLVLTLENGETARLRGKADRVDAAHFNGAEHYRIVDYKTGDASLNLSELYFGDKLQLPLYMNALLDARPGAKCAGLFYIDADPPFAVSKEERLKNYRLKGFILDDAKAVKKMDKQGEKLVFSTRIKKDGAVYGDTLDEQLMQKTLERAKRLAEASLSRALEGDAQARPLSRNKRLTCDHCDFSAICGFDEQIPGFKPNVPPALSEAEFAARMESD